MGKGKIPKTREKVSGKRSPKNIEDPNGWYDKKPSWVFSRWDKKLWSIDLCDNLQEDLIKLLISYEGMTWKEIMQSSGGRKNGTNSHFISMNDICSKAQKRAHELYLDIDEIFSLRLGSRKRLFGSIQDGVFSIIWYDPNHEICPIKK